MTTIVTKKTDAGYEYDYVVLSDGSLAPVCHRCFGDGGFACYVHVLNGVCFKCHGRRYVGSKRYSDEDAQKRADRLAKARATRYAKVQAEQEAKKAEYAAKKAAEDAVREAERIAKEAAHAAKVAAFEWVGLVGDKVTANGKVTVAMNIETMYGVSRLIVVESENAVYKIFGTGQTLWDVKQDDNVTVTGKVKGHETYNDIKQTSLTRAKVEVHN